MTTVTGAAADVVDKVRQRVDGGVRAVEQPHPDTVLLTIDREAVRPVATALVVDAGARFLISAGTDRRPLSGDFAVSHVFSLDAERLFVALECGVPVDDPHIDSITTLVPGAAWSERECHDAIGIHADGHPDPRRLLLADDWPEGVFPLRRDFRFDERPPSVEGARPPLADPPPGSSVVPIGPFFPVLEEPAYFRLFVEGERIVGCDYRGFYNHRGIEKLGDSTLTYNEIPYLAERICGICGFIHSSCYCQAVERAAGIEVPARGRFLRTVMLELERVHSHLLWLGIAGHIIGFDAVLMQAWRIREPVMWLAEAISGNRKTYGMNTVGGVRRDLSPEHAARTLEVLAELERETLAVRDAIMGDATLHARTRGVGLLSREWAQQVCVVGPPARASGVAIDARIDHPYAAYQEVGVRIATRAEGDVWARIEVRLDEIIDSVRQVREALATMPGGAIVADLRDPIPPGRMGVSAVEAPRGEAVHVVMTGGENRPWRWRVRAPTYPNLQAVPAMVHDQGIADVPITIGSLDPCFSCTERLEAVDVASRQVRVYGRRELMALARRGGLAREAT